MFVQKGFLGYLSVWISLFGDYSSFDCWVVLNKFASCLHYFPRYKTYQLKLSQNYMKMSPF